MAVSTNDEHAQCAEIDLPPVSSHLEMLLGEIYVAGESGGGTPDVHGPEQGPLASQRLGMQLAQRGHPRHQPPEVAHPSTVASCLIALQLHTVPVDNRIQSSAHLFSVLYLLPKAYTGCNTLQPAVAAPSPSALPERQPGRRSFPANTRCTFPAPWPRAT